MQPLVQTLEGMEPADGELVTESGRWRWTADGALHPPVGDLGDPGAVYVQLSSPSGGPASGLLIEVRAMPPQPPALRDDLALRTDGVTAVLDATLPERDATGAMVVAADTALSFVAALLRQGATLQHSASAPSLDLSEVHTERRARRAACPTRLRAALPTTGCVLWRAGATITLDAETRRVTVRDASGLEQTYADLHPDESILSPVAPEPRDSPAVGGPFAERGTAVPIGDEVTLYPGHRAAWGEGFARWLGDIEARTTLTGRVAAFLSVSRPRVERVFRNSAFVVMVIVFLFTTDWRIAASERDLVTAAYRCVFFAGTGVGMAVGKEGESLGARLRFAGAFGLGALVSWVLFHQTMWSAL